MKWNFECVDCKVEFTLDESKITSRTSDVIPEYPKDLPKKCILCGGELC